MKNKVLITRDPKRASALIEELKKENIEVFAAPVTTTEFLVDNADLQDLGKYDWLAFTSVNGVKGFKKVIQTQNIELPAGIKIAAVGEATAQFITEHLRQIDLVSKKADGAALAETIIESGNGNSGGSILWPCGESALDKLQTILENAGMSVERFVCYKTVAVNPDDLRKHIQSLPGWDLAVFAAPSAVKSFSSAWSDKENFIALAIGPTTAKSLINLKYKNVIISEGSSATDCAASIIKALKNRILI
jgi:uroporphyrinogen-III synthase